MTDKQKLTKVTLAQDHTHAGKKYGAGETIEVNEADLKWLREHQLIDGNAPAPLKAV